MEGDFSHLDWQTEALYPRAIRPSVTSFIKSSFPLLVLMFFSTIFEVSANRFLSTTLAQGIKLYIRTKTKGSCKTIVQRKIEKKKYYIYISSGKKLGKFGSTLRVSEGSLREEFTVSDSEKKPNSSSELSLLLPLKQLQR